MTASARRPVTVFRDADFARRRRAGGGEQYDPSSPVVVAFDD